MDQENPTNQPGMPPVQPGNAVPPVTPPSPEPTPAAPTPPPSSAPQPAATHTSPPSSRHTPMWAKLVVVLLLVAIVAELIYIFRTQIPGLGA